MASSKNNQKAFRNAEPRIWVKADDGNTYICPLSAVKDRDNVTSEELEACVNESYNPQNN